MGWFDDLVDDVGDAVSDVGSSIADAAEEVGSAAVDVAGSAGSYVGAAVGGLGAAVDAATGGAASSALNLVDDTVFDGVDYITDGVVNIDFDDGRFSASAGIPGIADVGASIGENGITASSDTLLGSTDVGLTDQGFQFASSGGIDWGPLPYYDGHINVSANGDVDINGHVQGTVPTPYGILSGEATAGFESTDQGWGASLDAHGTLTTETGVTIGAGVQAGYAESGGNSQTTFGLEGSVSEPGVGTIGGSFGYQSTTKDGVTVTTEQAEAHASGFGVNASAGEQYVGIDTPQGSVSQFDSGFDISGPSVNALENLGNSLLGGDVTGAATTGAAAATGAMGATRATGGAAGAADPTGGAGDDSMGGPAGHAAMPGPGAPAGGGGFDDDVLGTSAPSGAAAGPGAPAPAMGDDDVLMGSGPAAAGADAGAPANPDPGFGGSDYSSPSPDADGGAPEPAAPEAAPPMDTFDQSVGAADQMQSDLNSLTDNLSSGDGE